MVGEDRSREEVGENIPPEDTGVDAFIGVAGEAETGVGVAWFRGASDAGLEAGEKENMVEPWLPLLATGVEDSTAVNLKKKKTMKAAPFTLLNWECLCLPLERGPLSAVVHSLGSFLNKTSSWLSWISLGL